MKKSDLKSGMTVTLRDGSTYTVQLSHIYEGDRYNVLMDQSGTPALFVEDFNEDLTMDPDNEILGTEADKRLHPAKDYDIVKVEADGVVWERS